MERGHQFQQLSLFPREEGVPVGHQTALPITEHLSRNPGTFPDARPSGRDRINAGEHPVDVLHGGTYPMLMTGPEIRQQFQALDADRNATDESYHFDKYPSRIASRSQQLVVNRRFEKYQQGDRIPAHTKTRVTSRAEDDDELYARKHDESYDDDPYEQGHGLGEAIGYRGYDLSHPVSLSTGLKGNTKRPDPSAGRGDFGKHQVLGGHHRVAVMSEEYPSQFLSVQWAHNVSSAKQSRSY